MIVACDSTPAGNDGPEPGAHPSAGGAASGGEGVALALLPSSAEGMTAAAAGVLALRGRCLVIEAGDAFTHLAFATPETRWDSSARSLRVGDRSFRLGSHVRVGGGEFGGNADALAWVRRPAPECGARFWIVSSIGPA